MTNLPSANAAVRNIVHQELLPQRIQYWIFMVWLWLLMAWLGILQVQMVVLWYFVFQL